ncbi:PAXX protein, partial [Polypterus senegalus]
MSSLSARHRKSPSLTRAGGLQLWESLAVDTLDSPHYVAHAVPVLRRSEEEEEQRVPTAVKRRYMEDGDPPELYCVLRNSRDDERYLCSAERRGDDFRIWSAIHSSEALLTVKDAEAVLELQDEMSFDLSRLPHSQVKPKLQALLFGMADRIGSLELQVAEKRGSPGREFEPRKPTTGGGGGGSRGGGLSLAAVKSRRPGDSLINPGSKSLRATGDLKSWKDKRTAMVADLYKKTTYALRLRLCDTGQ